MNESRIEALSFALQAVQFLSIVYAVVIIILWFIKGGVWFSEEIFPIHAKIFYVLVILTFLVLIPMMVIKTTRPYSGLTLYQITYLFGGIAWFYSAHYCLYFIGIAWLIVGLFLAGIGVVPIAIIGTIFKGHWEFLIFLVIQLAATFGCRALAIYAISTSEDNTSGDF